MPLYEAGVIYHRRGDMEYEGTLNFPRGRRDDRVDCMSFGLMVVQNTTGQFATQFKEIKWLFSATLSYPLVVFA